MAFEHSTRKIYALIGELSSCAVMADNLIDSIVLDLFDMRKSTWSLAIMPILDSSRKLELIKERAKLLPPALDLRQLLLKFVEDVEKINAARNKAVHSRVVIDDNGEDYLNTFQLTKVLKSVRQDKTGDPKFSASTSMSELETAITLAHTLIGRTLAISQGFETFMRFFVANKEDSADA